MNAHKSGIWTTDAGGIDEYERSPKAIYEQSFAIARAEADLSGLPQNLHPLAIRLVHACGMPDITKDLRASDNLVDRALKALTAGAPIIADCEMVRAGITRRFLPKENEILCTLNELQVPKLAADLRTTRSAAAVSLWEPHLQGSVIVIGNAPTALFALLQMMKRISARPAAILGFPVGFVGAAESKAALAADPSDVPFVTLLGRRGGSAIAGAAVNAICHGLQS